MANKKLETLRSEIAKRTGRIPTSDDVGYLTRKLARLRRDNTHRGEPRAHVVRSVSMLADAVAATDDLAQLEGCGMSELVRRGLVLVAEKRGESKLARRIAGEADS